MDNFYYDYLTTLQNSNLEDNLEKIELFKKSASTYENLIDFLNDISLDTETVEDNVNKESYDERESIVISTVHRAKGLEWDYVFIVMFNENFFPSSRSVKNNEIEEERRLAYVAFTRAKKELNISYSNYYTRPGMQQVLNPSIFISEINTDFYDFERK